MLCSHWEGNVGEVRTFKETASLARGVSVDEKFRSGASLGRESIGKRPAHPPQWLPVRDSEQNVYICVVTIAASARTKVRQESVRMEAVRGFRTRPPAAS